MLSRFFEETSCHILIITNFILSLTLYYYLAYFYLTFYNVNDEECWINVTVVSSCSWVYYSDLFINVMHLDLKRMFTQKKTPISLPTFFQRDSLLYLRVTKYTNAVATTGTSPVLSDIVFASCLLINGKNIPKFYYV